MARNPEEPRGGDLNRENKKPVSERIKEGWNSFKATLKTTRGKVVLTLATIGACIIIAVTGTGIGAALAAGDVNNAVDSANSAINSGTQITISIDKYQDDLNSYTEFVTPEEQKEIEKISANVEAWQQKSEEVKSLVGNVNGNKNVFSAKNMAENELIPAVNVLNGFGLNENNAQIATLYNTVKGRAQGVEDAEVSANQKIIQSIINGEGSYYNMDEIQNIMNQINGYFVDADGDGIVDIQQSVNSIKNQQLQNLANTSVESMYDAKSSAESMFGLIQTGWNNVIQDIDSGNHASAISHYLEIEPSVSNLEESLTIIKAGYDNITNYLQQDEQEAQQTTIEGTFSESELSSYLTYFKGAGIKGTIDNVNYVYNKETGEVQIVVNSIVNSQDEVTVLTFTTSAGYKDIDAGSIINAHRDASAVSKSTYTMSNEAQYGSLTTSNNGSSQTITGNFNTGYSTTLNSANGMTTITINVIMQSEDGQIFSLGKTSKTVSGNTNIKSIIEDMVSSKIQSAGFSNSIENDIDLQ